MNIDGALLTCLRNAADMKAEAKYSDAKDEFLTAVSMEPSEDILGEIYFQLGVCYMKLREFTQSEECLEKSAGILQSIGISDTSHISEALILLYETWKDEKKLEKFCLDVLIKDRFNFNASLTLVDIYIKRENYIYAERVVKDALEFNGNDPRILRACICIEYKLEKYRDAIEHSKIFYQLNGGYDLMVNVAVADIRQKIGPVSESLRLYEEAYNECEAGEKFGLSGSMLSISAYDDVYDKDKYLELIKFRLEYTSKLQKNKLFSNETSFFKKLRIGYLSNDFKVHPVGFFVIPVLKQSRESHSSFICYNIIMPDKRDYVGDYIYQNAGSVVDLCGKSDDELEQFILEDKPDIMMELKSVSNENKLLLYARRLAPVQISWIGFPLSAGVASIDYILADRCVDPYPEAQELYSEKLLYLKDTFLCHEMVIEESSKELPYYKNSHITFGCFNNYIKITDRILKLWSEILASVENSKIVFKANLYGDDYVVELLTERLLKFGFAPESFIIEPPERIDMYFKSYDNVDIILDTYPFNGATTTFDALLLGTPVVTLVGDKHVSRVGLDFLSHVGLEDLVCRSDREYVDKAVSLANDINRLEYLKKNLRDITMSSKLTDGSAFRIEYEHALRKVWIDYCIKKRKEDKPAYMDADKSVSMLRDELLNGADYIVKCIREAEFPEVMRCLLLDEYMAVYGCFMEKIIQTGEYINNESVAVIKRLNSLVCKLKNMNNEQIIKVLESNVIVLERLL